MFEKIECEQPFTPDQQECHSAEEDERRGLAASSFDDALDWFLYDKGSSSVFEAERSRATMYTQKKTNPHRRNLSYDHGSPSPLRRSCIAKKSLFGQSDTEAIAEIEIAKLTAS